MGRVQEAKGEFETVRRLRPDFEPAKSVLQRLRADNPSVRRCNVERFGGLLHVLEGFQLCQGRGIVRIQTLDFLELLFSRRRTGPFGPGPGRTPAELRSRLASAGRAKQGGEQLPQGG